MNIPMIAIWGNEDSPSFFRLGGAQKDNESLKALGQIDDTKLVTVVNKVGSYCSTIKDNYRILKIAAIATLNWPLALYYSSREDAWNVSRNYWNGQIQEGCDYLIGAKRYETQYITVYDYICNPDPKARGGKDMDDDGWWELNCDYVPRQEAVQVLVSEANDGLLPKSSQIAMTGCNVVREAEHVNHEELKNSIAVRDILVFCQFAKLG